MNASEFEILLRELNEEVEACKILLTAILHKNESISKAMKQIKKGYETKNEISGKD